MVKKFLTKKAVKQVASSAVQQQIKVLIGAISTIVIHRVIQYLANKYPRLSFLKMAQTERNNLA